MSISSLMRVLALRRARFFLGTSVPVIVVTTVVFGGEVRHGLSAAEITPMAELVNVPVARSTRARTFVLDDTLFGASGAVRVRLLALGDVERVPGLRELFGDEATRRPGVLGLSTPEDAEAFAFVTLRPWREKRGEYVGRYHLGWWPSELSILPAKSENPPGFIEVTPENESLRISDHFRLRDFVTHDQQQDVWPKYVVLREALLDKLELVMSDLSTRGVRAGHARVLSGFRSPYHNSRGVLEGNAAQASRHQYGDAADLIIDDDRDGRMDDLNRDGRVDLGDADVVLRAVERVERTYPELVGGLGLYHAMGPSGPFAHIDVRGTRARWLDWGGAGRRQRGAGAGRQLVADAGSSVAHAVSGCSATGTSASLCVRPR